MLVRINKEVFYNKAEDMLNRRLCSRRLFKSHFGVSCKTAVSVWNRCRLNVKVEHFLWSLMYLKSYPTEETLASMVGTTPKTLRLHVWKVIEKIAATHSEFVSFILCFAIFMLFFLTQFLSRLCFRSSGRIDFETIVEKPAR